MYCDDLYGLQRTPLLVSTRYVHPTARWRVSRSSAMSLDTEISATKAVDRQPHPLDAAAERVELSVVMPCLNERETVGVCVRKAIATLQNACISGEVIVADNGSTDGSVEIAQAEGARV